MLLCGVFMCVELVGGYYAHSLAVMSDAAHLLSDLGAFCVSLLALTVAGRRAPAGGAYSFGYHRLEVVGALFSVATLWLVTGVLLTEAVHRLNHPENVQGGVMFAIALAGVAVNAALVAVLSGAGGHGHSHGGLSGAGGGCGEHAHAVHAPAMRDQGGTSASLDATAVAPPAREHSGGCCGTAPPPPAGAASDGAAPPPPDFPQGAVFFTRGQRPSSPPPQPDAADVTRLYAAPGSRDAAPPVADEEAGTRSSDVASAPACEEPAQDMNMRGAYLHVLGDLLQSLGVALAGGLIWWRPGLRILDPLLTFLFSFLVLATTARLLRDIVDIIMERTPRGLDADAVAHSLTQLPGVAGVHDLHIWAIMPGKPVLTVHVRHAPGAQAPPLLLQTVQEHCLRVYGIHHVTVQVEPR